MLLKLGVQGRFKLVIGGDLAIFLNTEGGHAVIFLMSIVDELKVRIAFHLKLE